MSSFTLLCVSGMIGTCNAQSTPAVKASEPAGEAPIASAFESRIAIGRQESGIKSQEFSWTYQNRWDNPLKVESFVECCGCLKGILNQEPVAPGQTGQIRATLTPGALRGKIRKSFYVRFVGHKDPVELTIETTVPSPVELSLQELSWTGADREKSQSIDVTSGTGTEFQITSLDGISDTQYKIASEVIKPGLHYRISITPQPGVSEGLQTLILKTNSPDPRDQVMAVFLKWQRAAAVAPAQAATL